MRAVSCALALLVATVLGGASFAPAALPAARDGSAPPMRLAHCTAPGKPRDDAAHPKPSSFAPHAGPRSRVYGAPIQPRILKSRPKPGPKPGPKPEPQLKTSELPAAGA